MNRTTKGGESPIEQLLAIRRDNLRSLINQWGAQEVAKRLDLAQLSKVKPGDPDKWNTSYLGHLTSGRRPITEAKAAHIETVFGLSPGWMSTAHAHGGDVPNLLFSPKLLTAAMRAVERAAPKMDSDKKARIVTLVYARASESGSIDTAYVQELVELVKG